MIVVSHDVSGRMADNSGSTVKCTVQFDGYCPLEEYKRLLLMLASGGFKLKEDSE